MCVCVCVCVCVCERERDRERESTLTHSLIWCTSTDLLQNGSVVLGTYVHSYLRLLLASACRRRDRATFASLVILLCLTDRASDMQNDVCRTTTGVSSIQ